MDINILYENREGNDLNVGIRLVGHPAFRGYAFKYALSYGKVAFHFCVGEEGVNEMASFYTIERNPEDIVNLVQRITGSINRKECSKIASFLYDFGACLRNRLKDDIEGRAPREVITSNMYERFLHLDF